MKYLTENEGDNWNIILVFKIVETDKRRRFCISMFMFLYTMELRICFGKN